MTLFYENLAYSLITAYFFAVLLYGKEDAIIISIGLAGSIVLLILTYYNEYLKRNRS
jgi:hypothetical protein